MRVRVRVPATSANLGPGFDSLGLALAIHDEVEVAADPGDGPAGAAHVRVAGIGAGTLRLDDGHLVVRAVRTAAADAGVTLSRLSVICHNDIPHGRGLGSSAAAIVAGVAAARALAGLEPTGPGALAVAAEMEGHPDNVAPCLLGGLTTAWTTDDGRSHAVRADVHPDVIPVVCVPSVSLPTRAARALLPETVPHRDAAANAGRAALLIEALTRRPDLLFDATEDRLHQQYRRSAMPETIALVTEFRRRGLPAVVSGAGPSVLVLATADQVPAVRVDAEGWDVRAVRVQREGTRVEMLDGSRTG
jgi:homoserine kinase